LRLEDQHPVVGREISVGILSSEGQLANVAQVPGLLRQQQGRGARLRRLGGLLRMKLGKREAGKQCE